MRKLLLQGFLLLIFLGISINGTCQSNKAMLDQLARRLNAYTDSMPRASIYLNTSKDIYESGEDLWFKAYLLDAQYHDLFSFDKTVYVRLVRIDTDSTAWEEKYISNNGVASGHIFLDYTLPEGNYILTAFSAHSLYTNTPYFHSLKMIRVVKDTQSLSKEKAALLTSDTNPQQHIQFTILPEGGRLISGLENTVAFKAVDKNGDPVDVSGELLQGNLPVSTLKSKHDGMGSFSFKPVPGAIYHVRLTQKDTDKLYPLPPIQDTGVALHLLDNEGDRLLFRITQSSSMPKQTVFIRLQVRGRVQAMATVMLIDSLKIRIPTINAPQGIAEVTLFDQQMRPIAERLVYLNSDRLLKITTALIKKDYKTREKVTLKISTADQDGKPVQANISVNVFDKIYHNTSDGKDILTHYYLATELKGKIYNPSYYFNNANKDRKDALDLLLLTQGWRCYLWNEDELKDFKNRKPVLSDSTKGRLVAINPKNYKPNINVLMTFSNDESEKRSLFTDSIGRFALGPEDFVKGRWSYLKHFDVGKREYTVSVEDQFRKIVELSKKMKFNYPLQKRMPAEDDIPLDRINLGAINLNEVKIVSKKQGVFRDKYMSHLDSLAKLDGNTDFVSPNSNWLNVPVGYTGPKPIEGKTYTVWIGPRPLPTSFPFYFGSGDFEHIIYKYPKFTEEELLKKFNLTRIKGFYEKREFYQPNYDIESNSLPDYRNTLLWVPNVITDNNGQATLEFYGSDINSSFQGIIEGVGGEGLLGKKDFHFNVVK